MAEAIDSDEVYQQAVQKLRMLLSASEAAIMGEEEHVAEETSQDDDNGSFFQLNKGPSQGLTDPPILKTRPMSGKFIKNRRPRVRRNLFSSKRNDQVKHNSWHNLTQIDGTSRTTQEELALVKSQENYIKQLEKETIFCREQLAFVLKNVKDVLREQATSQKSSEVKTAITDVFSTIRGWQSNVPYGDFHSPSPEITEKAKEVDEGLSKAIHELKTELNEVRHREEEAVEEVKRSVSVAEQLRMEKSELEFELEQTKAQVERLQTKIKTLNEEHEAELKEEITAVKTQSQNQLKSVKEEMAVQIEEITRLTATIDQDQRQLAEMSKKLKSKEKVIEDLQNELQSQVDKLQHELMKSQSSLKESEATNRTLKLELDNTRFALKSSEVSYEKELQSLQTRLSKAEGDLKKSQNDVLELVETKSALDAELTKLRKAEVDQSRKDRLSELARYEDMIRRQSRIIKELRDQCSSVTDKLEETAISFEEDKKSLIKKLESMKDERTRLINQISSLQSSLLEKERVQIRLEQMDATNRRLAVDLKKSILDCESIKQEKSSVEYELEFFKNILKSKGLLPERDKDVKKSNLEQEFLKKQPVVCQRQGKLFVPTRKK